MQSFGFNLGAVLRLLVSRSGTVALPEPGVGQIILAVAINWAVQAMSVAWLVWPVGSFEVYGLSSLLAAYTTHLAGLAIGAMIVGRGDRMASLVFATAIAGAVGVAAVAIFWSFLGNSGTFAAWWAVYLISLLPVLVVIWRLTAGSGFVRGLRALPAVALYLAVIVGASIWLPRDWMFYPAEVTEAEADYVPVDVEALYSAQAGLMEAQTGALVQGTPGKVELFALLAGGTAYQGVFLSEVEKTADLLTDRFDAGGRILQLANSEREPTRLPMANRANLAAAMTAMASRMDESEDIALIFLTSHGGPDVFSLAFYEAGTKDLRAAELAEMLETSGLRNVVLVLSACHSGSFIDDLAAPDRLIVTAAAADRTSFGCADGNVWTRWGEAFFATALRETRDFRRAFTRASALVGEWETAGGQTPSLPQMAEGEAIGPALDRWLEEVETHTPG